MNQRCYNYFAPGPAHLPEVVLNKLEQSIYNFNASGISILEISHRHPYIKQLIDENINDLRHLLHIPDEFAIVFMPGGASYAFANIPLNLAGKKILYISQGRWGEKAFLEAQKIDKSHIEIRLDINNYSSSEINQLAKQCDFVHYVHNETAHGIRWNEPLPILDKPLIADMSSDILTQPINWNNHAIVYAGGSKNLGIAGFNVIIIRKALLEATPSIANVFSFKNIFKHNSLYNTPPIIQYYVLHLMLKWTIEQGGVEFFSKKTLLQSELIYNVIDQYPHIYTNHIKPEYRSQTNMVFNLVIPKLLTKFLEKAKQQGLMGLKGHWDVGGLRISAYNSISLSQIELVAKFMQNFATSIKLQNTLFD